jgi:hypothetical protein
MPDAALPEIEIFRAGRHVAVDGTVVEVTHADLAAIADAYDPALGEAPHVIGHPKLNAPAYGWVKQLEARDGVLFAAASDQVDPAFADIVAAGRYKKRSASFFLPNSPGNPKPGSMYLRHVGWLGAAAPAVTGLRDVQFAAGEQGVVEFGVTVRPWTFRSIADVFGRIRDYFVERDGVEKADQLLPRYVIDDIAAGADVADEPSLSPSFAAPAPSPETVMPDTTTADFAARESALATRQHEIEQREKALRDRERETQRAAVVEFAAGLVAAGRLLPRQQAPIVELLVALEGAEQPHTLNFAAADGTQTAVAAGAALRTFLGELPVQVDFAERGAGEHPGHAADFAAPPDVQVDRSRMDLHAKAQAYQRQHPNTPYLDAVRAVGG